MPRASPQPQPQRSDDAKQCQRGGALPQFVDDVGELLARQQLA